MPSVLMDMFRGRGLVCWGQARFSTRPLWPSTPWLPLSSAECCALGAQGCGGLSRDGHLSLAWSPSAHRGGRMFRSPWDRSHQSPRPAPHTS